MSAQLPEFTLRIMLPGNEGEPGDLATHYGHPHMAILDSTGTVAGVIRGVGDVTITASGSGGFMEITAELLAEVTLAAGKKMNDGH